MVDADVITGALALAVRAPSLHNSQRWRWVAAGGVLELFADPTRIGRSTDSTGREVLISCGAVLDHLRVAMAAAGWEGLIDRFPTPNNHDHLATLEFRPMDFVTDAHRARGESIRHRQTDRLPFAAPPQWHSFEPVLRETVAGRSPTLTSSPMIRGHNWPAHHGSLRKCAATTRPTTPNFSGGRRDRTRHTVFRQVRSYPKRSVNASMWLGTSRPAGTANGARLWATTSRRSLSYPPSRTPARMRLGAAKRCPRCCWSAP
jgi:hypothetical protein